MVKNTFSSYRKFSISQLLRPSPWRWGSQSLRGHTWESLACGTSRCTGEKAGIMSLVLLALPGAAGAGERQPLIPTCTFRRTLHYRESLPSQELPDRKQRVVLNSEQQLILLILCLPWSKGWLSNTELSKQQGLLLDLRFQKPGAGYLLCKASRPSHINSAWGKAALRPRLCRGHRQHLLPGRTWLSRAGAAPTSQHLHGSCIIAPDTFLLGQSWWDALPAGWDRSSWSTVTPCGADMPSPAV